MKTANNYLKTEEGVARTHNCGSGAPSKRTLKMNVNLKNAVIPFQLIGSAIAQRERIINFIELIFSAN